MKTTPVTKQDLQRSVLAVPPLARNADLSLNAAENARLVRYMEAGGVSSFLYGGNANLYHVPMGEFRSLLDMLSSVASAESWVIPSIGSDYGKLIEQAAILRDYEFPTAMVLPQSGLATSAGIATGIRHAADRAGRPLIAYIKAENYIGPADLAALVNDGAVVAVKYGTVRSNPAEDDYLRGLTRAVDPLLIISGIGERPVITHMRDFGLVGFTSGSVCLAPRLSMAILRALLAGDHATAAGLRERFMAVEDLRDRHSPIVTLHDAVTLSGIADMGPILPLLSNLSDPAVRKAVQEAATALLAADDAEGRRAAA